MSTQFLLIAQVKAKCMTMGKMHDHRTCCRLPPAWESGELINRETLAERRQVAPQAFLDLFRSRDQKHRKDDCQAARLISALRVRLPLLEQSVIQPFAHSAHNRKLPLHPNIERVLTPMCGGCPLLPGATDYQELVKSESIDPR